MRMRHFNTGIEPHMWDNLTPVFSPSFWEKNRSRKLAAAVLLCFLLLLCAPLFQAAVENPGENGYRFIRNYNRKDYGFHPQNWFILEDSRGMIYAANQGGVIEYDGAEKWRQIHIMTARSLAIDDSGVIYVGGDNEIGCIGTKPNGLLEYVSLLPQVDEKEQNFGLVRKTHAAKEGIYFRTEQFIFRWDPLSRRMKTWKPLVPDSTFAGSFVCREQLYIRHRKVGLMQMVNDKLELVPGGELFAQVGVYAMFPYDDRELVIGTREKGLYLYNGSRMLPFPTEVDNQLKEKQLSHAVRLESRPGFFALATERGGLLIIDSRGRLKEVFNTASGLQCNMVRYVFEDSRGNFWLALDNGISKIEYFSPLSFYNEKISHLPGLVLSVVRHGPRQDLYVGTTWGLFMLLPGGKFRQVPGITTNCYCLLSTGDSLLAASEGGLFQLDTKNSAPTCRRVIEAPAFFLFRSRQEPLRIWAVTSGGLFFLSRKQGRWQLEHRLKNIRGENATMVEDDKGNLWIGTSNSGVKEVDFPTGWPAGKTADVRVTGFNKDHGLPTGKVDPFWAAGHVIFATAKGIYRYIEEERRFVPDNTLGKDFAGGACYIGCMAEDKNKHIWFSSFDAKFENFCAVPRFDGTYLVEGKPLRRLPSVQVNSIYPDPRDDVTWFAGNEGLVRFDTTLKKDYDMPFRAFVRRVELMADRTVIFGGKRTGDIDFPVPQLEYKNRNIRFSYAAPFFEDESATRFQTFLEGYDKEWADWTAENIKEYINLDAGLYTFRVRGQNVHGNTSSEDRFRFRVLPPWYQTWWAYSIYIFLFFSGTYLIFKWRSWKLIRDKQRLEGIVKERTKEVYEKNLLLEEQSEKLKELDKTKSRFFANISHEFRTPLTLIMGPLQQVLSNTREKKQAENINLALKNSRRLLGLINQLLDLSKLESGRMKLSASRQDFIPFLKGLVGSFESAAQQKKLDLTFKTGERELLLYFDAEKMEKVIGNLIANAVKFTPPGGKIAVTAAAYPPGAVGREDAPAAGSKKMTKDSPGQKFPAGCVEVRVRDTGVGIREDQLPYIFDRFFQAGNGFSHEFKHKGSGIGLALVKELVALHHGEVEVGSRQGEGSEFTVRLHLGSAHLKGSEISQQESYDESGFYVTGAAVEAEEMGAEAAEPGKAGEDIEPGTKEKDVILIVEDNPDVRKFIREPLEDGYTVVEAADGAQGIEKARGIIPDLIISDIMMPGVDGYQLCSELKEDVKTSHIPIILLTAKASEESIITGLKTGADDYVTKPFNTAILLTRIKNLIDLRRQLQEKIQREMVLRPTEIAVSSVDQQFMEELKKAIEKNISDENFGVDELAAALYMGRATLNRKIKALSGESTRQFVQSYRLKRAAQLLKANFGNVTEVSFEVGFSSSGYFTKCFKKKFHQLPHDFQAAEIGNK